LACGARPTVITGGLLDRTYTTAFPTAPQAPVLIERRDATRRSKCLPKNHCPSRVSGAPDARRARLRHFETSSVFLLYDIWNSIPAAENARPKRPTISSVRVGNAVVNCAPSPSTIGAISATTGGTSLKLRQFRRVRNAAKAVSAFPPRGSNTKATCPCISQSCSKSSTAAATDRVTTRSEDHDVVSQSNTRRIGWRSGARISRASA
jgi:hypothetical protein